MKPQLFVFDLAGTTVKDNQYVHRVLQKALLKESVSISISEANQIMGIPKPVAIEKLLTDKGFTNISPGWIDHIHSNFVEEMIRFYETDERVGEKEGVSETFRILKSHGIKVAVDTGFDRPITEAILKRLKWKENNLLDVSVTSDEVAQGRPFPDLIFKAMKLAGVTEAASVAKVGDTASDMQEGTRAGCTWVIGVTTGSYSHDELLKQPHTHLVENLLEVLPIVGIKN
jgi:phosphonatase-like hydrolase